MIILARDNRFERGNGFVQRHLNTIRARKHFRHVKGLRQETLELTRPGYRQLIIFAQFIHAQNRNDILQGFITLKYLLHIRCNRIMLFTDDHWVKQP